MSEIDRIKISVTSSEMALASYWGKAAETVICAAEIMRSNPRVTVEDAIRKGFRSSAKSLEPMPIVRR